MAAGHVSENALLGVTGNYTITNIKTRKIYVSDIKNGIKIYDVKL